MTSKKGSLWKTSWNRGRGTPLPDLVQMAFFQRFASVDDADEAVYSTGATPSSLGTELPFWFASVGVNIAGGLAFQSVSADDPAFRTVPTSGDGFVAATGFVAGVSIAQTLPVLGDLNVCASLISVIKTGATSFAARCFLDDQLYSYVEGDPFTAAAAALIFSPKALPGGLHGFCGGQGFTPTDAEIHEWFRALKANREIKEIPGKTTHRYSAATAYPLTPNPLPNQGTDGAAQNLALTVLSGAPSPQNNLLNVRFPY